MKTKAIEFTEQEAQVLLNLLNVAVQVKGLEAAEAALHLAKKIQASFAPANGVAPVSTNGKEK